MHIYMMKQHANGVTDVTRQIAVYTVYNIYIYIDIYVCACVLNIMEGIR